MIHYQNEKGESEGTDISFWTKTVSHEIGEKLVLPASEDHGIQVSIWYLNVIKQRKCDILTIVLTVQAIKVTPLVWIFLAIISVLVLMIVLIGLLLRARGARSSRHKAKFVRAEASAHAQGQTSAQALLKENVRAGGARGNNPDLIPDTGLS